MSVSLVSASSIEGYERGPVGKTLKADNKAPGRIADFGKAGYEVDGFYMFARRKWRPAGRWTVSWGKRIP